MQNLLAKVAFTTKPRPLIPRQVKSEIILKLLISHLKQIISNFGLQVLAREDIKRVEEE
jgi:hypothetical protein